MEEHSYEYHVVYLEPTQAEIQTKNKDGWEICDAPEGIIGRDVNKEPNYAHPTYYFRRKI